MVTYLVVLTIFNFFFKSVQVAFKILAATDIKQFVFIAGQLLFLPF